ncbi:MAG: hypothetical protein JW739_06615 [Opitutales bacterium]|nr:hypothetical protein [Opitutales bacterium]
MIDAIKKTLLIGLGATVTTAEKIESALDDFVKKGKLSADEAKEVARKITEDGKKEYEEAKATLTESIEELLQKYNFATQKQLKALEERVAQLEGPPKDSE